MKRACLQCANQWCVCFFFVFPPPIAIIMMEKHATTIQKQLLDYSFCQYILISKSSRKCEKKS